MKSLRHPGGVLHFFQLEPFSAACSASQNNLPASRPPPPLSPPAPTTHTKHGLNSSKLQEEDTEHREGLQANPHCVQQQSSHSYASELNRRDIFNEIKLDNYVSKYLPVFDSMPCHFSRSKRCCIESINHIYGIHN